MQYTYIASDNSATNGTALSVDNKDITVYQLIFGTPSDGTYAKIYDIVNPFSSATTDIAAYITQPTAAAGKDWLRTVDFGPGLRLGEGGNVVTNASQVTVIWDYTK
jgi:hypothetical protein